MNKKYRTIKWEDHTSDGNWKQPQELVEWATKKVICTTVGLVTYEDKRVIVLSATNNTDGDYGENMCILKKCIVK